MGQQRTQFWCVAQTAAGKEDFAIAHLERQGFRVFCPKLPTVMKFGRTHKQVTRPLFPGYCFVGVDVDQCHWRAVTGTRGVSKVVMSGSHPARMPAGTVERMMDLSGADGCMHCDQELASGDHIRVVGGPFDDWLGRVINTRPADRIIVLMNIMSRDLPVTLRRSQVRSVEKTSNTAISAVG